MFVLWKIVYQFSVWIKLHKMNVFCIRKITPSCQCDRNAYLIIWTDQIPHRQYLSHRYITISPISHLDVQHLSVVAFNIYPCCAGKLPFGQRHQKKTSKSSTKRALLATVTNDSFNFNANKTIEFAVQKVP